MILRLSSTPTVRCVRVVAVWLACLALAVFVVVRARYITDLSAFLPAHPTPVQQLLVDQLREGPASRLILIAVEGADAAARARVSREMVERLRRDVQFVSINDGDALAGESDREFLFKHRYLLSESVTQQRFSPSGLHAAIEDTIAGLASPAGLLFKSLLPRDPTGELMNIVDQLARAPVPQSRDGVWVSADGNRTLAIAQTAARGSDSDAQSNAIDAIKAAFAGSVSETPATAATRLRVSGPGVFAVAARAKIERAAVRLSLISGLLVVTLLLAVYRSLSALCLGLLPVATGALVGIASVALGFGAVHGITLGFGITLIGESVDYSIYFFIQSGGRRAGERAAHWRTHWWPTIRLGMLTSVCGFASLLPSGFPGLQQLGLYSICGLIAASLVTRYLLPALLPAGFVVRDVSPFGKVIGELLRSSQRISGRALFVAATALALLTLAVLYHGRAALWNRELAALSPISLEDQNYDAQLRADLGADDVRDMVIVSGHDMESALRNAELAAQALQPLIAQNIIAGFASPADYLPSRATQESRRDSLPSAAQLRANLKLALVDLPVGQDRLQPFLEDIAATRHEPLIGARDMQATSLRTGFDSLMLRQRDHWNALLPLRAHAPGEVIDSAKITAALRTAHVQEAQVLDLKGESDELYASYLEQALHFSLAGLLALTLLLLIALRSPRRVARVLAPLALAVLSVAAMLAAAGVQLNILHLVGMLLIVAVGSNYALFFDAQAHASDEGELSLTLASLAIANASTVIGFGLLSFSQIPVLVALGSTVAPGTFLALLFAAIGFRGSAVHA